jgi:hypothetical protein
LSPQRSEKSVFGRPPEMQPSEHSGIRDLEMFTQFDQTTGYATDRKDSVAAPIPSLLIRCGPLAIAGFIALVVVDSIKACSWRTGPHVSNELFERSSPLRADSYAATTIIGKRNLGRVCTSVNHVCPDFVNGGFVAGECLSVGDEGVSHPVFPVASAGLGVSRGETIVGDCDIVTTLAGATASGLRSAARCPSRRGVSDYGKSSKFLSYEGYFGRHTDGHASVLFSGGYRRQPVPAAIVSKPA